MGEICSNPAPVPVVATSDHPFLGGSGESRLKNPLREKLYHLLEPFVEYVVQEFQHVSSFNFQNPAPARGQFNLDGRYAGQPFADFLLGASSGTTRVSLLR